MESFVTRGAVKFLSRREVTGRPQSPSALSLFLNHDLMSTFTTTETQFCMTFKMYRRPPVRSNHCGGEGEDI